MTKIRIAQAGAVALAVGLAGLAGLAGTSCTTTSKKDPTATAVRTNTAIPTNTSIPVPTNTNTPAAVPTPTLASYMYIYGGDDDSGSAVSAAYSAQINAGGVLGTWTSTNALPVAITNIGYCFDGSYAFAIGGTDLSTIQSTVYYAAMNGATLGPWMQASPIPTPSQLLGAGVSNGQLWVWDARSGGVYVAPMSGGLPGAWTVAAAVPTGVAGGQYGSDATHMYTAGGDSNGGPNTNASRSALAGTGGAPGTWMAGPNLAATVAYGGYYLKAGIFSVIGGTTSSTWSTGPLSTVYTSASAAGTIGAWATQPAIPIAVFQPAVVRTGGYLYSVGGLQASFTTGNQVYKATITGSTVGTWGTEGNLPIHVEAHGVAVR